MLRKPSLADSRHGLTLVELLVAMVLSMMLILAISRYFKFIGDTVRDGRAALEMAGQLHSATMQLDQDVNHLTAVARPGGDISAAGGYLEIVEGGMHDFSAVATDSALGDVDDMIAFTAVSVEHPFSGQLLFRTIDTSDPAHPRYSLSGTGPIQYATIRSPNAEIIYWVTFNDSNGNGSQDYTEVYSLHRRVLVVAPNVRLDNTYAALTQNQFFNIVDISCHHTGALWVSNNLSELSRRENRFAHVQGPAAFPNLMFGPANIPSLADIVVPNVPPANTTRHGDDILMSHIMAFDVRVFDPTAVIHASASGTDAVAPGDPGYPTGNPIGSGAFVDLNYNRYVAGNSVFSRPPNVRSGLNRVAVYDTWSTSYERDGIDQNGNRIADEGTNGIDDNNASGVDDASEHETSAPYPVPLRGVQITVRTIDTDTRQVQQVIVTANFTP